MADSPDGSQGPPKPSSEVRRRLSRLGLSWGLLWEAIAEGERARQKANSYEPRPAAGLRDWIARVGTLRRLLGERGWTAVNRYHIALSVNPEHTIGVGVLLGDDDTGQPDPRRPRSKYPKGPQVLDMAASNALFSTVEFDESLLEPEDIARLQIWLLVTYRRTLPREEMAGPKTIWVHSELSSPGKPSASHIDTWVDRILLPLSSFPPPPESLPGSDDLDDLTGEM